MHIVTGILIELLERRVQIRAGGVNSVCAYVSAYACVRVCVS